MYMYVYHMYMYVGSVVIKNFMMSKGTCSYWTSRNNEVILK